MSLPAFYLPPDSWGKNWTLTGEEAQHLQVLRLRKGEKILLLDGKGKTAVCEVAEIGKRDTKLDLLEIRDAREPESRPIIALALSKGARRGFFMEKAAELGAWEIWVWQAERSPGRIDAKFLEACAARLRAGAKQCHNPWFPGLISAGSAENLACLAQSCQLRLLPWEVKAGEPVIGFNQLGCPGSTIYIIGPEGGITEKEAACLFSAGFTAVSLGERVLRCETAATLCLGLHWWAFQVRKNVE